MADQLIVNVEFRAKSLGDRLYSLFAMIFLGLALAILGKGGVTIKNSEDTKITIVHE